MGIEHQIDERLKRLENKLNVIQNLIETIENRTRIGGYE